MKYSIVTTTVRGIEKLMPFFITPSEDAELIIVPKSRDEQVLEFLKKQSGFAQIVYPEPHLVYHYPTDIQQCRNTGIMYAEGERVILMDDSIELKKDLWDKLDEAVKCFPNHIILFQKLHEVLGERKWINVFSTRQNKMMQRYYFINDPQYTLNFGAVRLADILAVNGIDIIYDAGQQWYEDTLLLAHLIRKGVRVVYDTHCMGYKFAHPEFMPPFRANKWLYDVDIERCRCGCTWAYNPYSIQVLREEKLKEKEKWIVSN